MTRAPRTRWPTLALASLLLLAGCASPEPPVQPLPMRPSDARALLATLLPAATLDRPGWATDIYAAFASMNLPVGAESFCAVIAVAEQESGLRADPSVPGLGAIAAKEIDARAARAGVPSLLVGGALGLASPTGKTYRERIESARTERELSDTFDDFIGMVPLGKRLFADWNPVHTGGPMQVSVAYAERHAAARPYPYGGPATRIRQEVFTRRGGLYFGIAHLLDYPAAYPSPLYRFADFNAGHWASRNAALQQAITLVSGIPLALDGDLVRNDGDGGAVPGATELAARVLAARLDMTPAAIRRDLEHGDRDGLERTALHRRVFALAERLEGRPLPRAVLPQIDLKSPKFSRKLTTAWFAERVDERYRRCLARR